jgi:hypothetical protein
MSFICCLNRQAADTRLKKSLPGFHYIHIGSFNDLVVGNGQWIANG